MSEDKSSNPMNRFVKSVGIRTEDRTDGSMTYLIAVHVEQSLEAAKAVRDYISSLVTIPDETAGDDARDAARYRFLRQPCNAIVYAKDRNAWGKNASGHVRYDTAEQLDAAVDAARGAEEQLCNCGEFCNKSLGQPHAGTCRRLKQGLPVNGDGKQNG